MAPSDRDAQLGELVVWRGRPKVLETPRSMRACAVVLFALAAVSLCFAVAISFTLKVTPTESVLFAAWSTLFGVLVLQIPKIWLSEVQYLVTEKHVVMQRGLFRRTIERKAISFARIRWSPTSPGVGDIDLVRAVPTGALRRRLLLQLRGVVAPDRVWSIIRGVESSIGVHKGDRPLTQRLDDGERVVWSARPKRTSKAYMPRGRREIGVLALSAMLFFAFVSMIERAVPNLRTMLVAGLPSGSFLAIVLGEAIAALLVLGTAIYFLYEGLITPIKNLRQTRYLITDRRVLIQRGREELQLDRERIVDVIPARTTAGLTDVFLVLDGPRARALAISGAFGEGDSGVELSPVLESVEDAESVSRILLSSPPSRKAA